MLISHSAASFFFQMNKRLMNGMVSPWLVTRNRRTLSCWITRGFFKSHSQTLKGLPLKPPLTAKRLRLRMELSCMVMSSVWIILGSQTQVLFRPYLPLRFASMLHPPLTFWRISCQILATFAFRRHTSPLAPHMHVCVDALAKNVCMFMLSCVRFYFD